MSKKAANQKWQDMQNNWTFVFGSEPAVKVKKAKKAKKVGFGTVAIDWSARLTA